MSYDKATNIIRQVSLEHGVPVELITSKSRTATIASARKVAIARIRLETKLSWAECNSLFKRSPRSHR